MTSANKTVCNLKLKPKCGETGLIFFKSVDDQYRYSKRVGDIRINKAYMMFKNE